MPALRLPRTKTIPDVSGIRAVFIDTLSKCPNSAHEQADRLFESVKPNAVISIERPGMNKMGIYHNLGGRDISSATTDLDYLFDLARRSDVPTVAFGDGGNEIGMGVVQEELPELALASPCAGQWALQDVALVRLPIRQTRAAAEDRRLARTSRVRDGRLLRAAVLGAEDERVAQIVLARAHLHSDAARGRAGCHPFPHRLARPE